MRKQPIRSKRAPWVHTVVGTEPGVFPYTGNYVFYVSGDDGRYISGYRKAGEAFHFPYGSIVRIEFMGRG